MALGERDEFSGQMTTGHEWNGIKELNSPVPKPVYLALIAFGGFAILWTVLMPSWPGLNGYFRGLLGADQHVAVRESLTQAQAARATWADRIGATDFASIQADESLMQVVRDTGATLFADNCAGCHGAKATGGPGFPNLANAPAMWGDEPETIAETIRVGINGQSPETRYAQMLAFGRDKMLSGAEIGTVVTYVESLSKPEVASSAEPELLAAGAEIFANNCAGCHGLEATGMVESGAPNLADEFWIYGGDRASIRDSVYHGRAGTMPSWEGRLSPTDIKLLTLYVLELRQAQQ
ncbi:MAG TPA: cytochrome-c oxidase, cbb3-type subunit III [Pseudorhizobium sp.]|jgi:cytochrome c oxidase cbb3-type subunit 3|nr:cytochrome-c oxidase, cbb3-type subunit III [Pseudorhizobium sp.]